MDAFQSDDGNCLLEMLLFFPLALFFLFVVVDAGMALHDRSGVVEAVRSGTLAHPAFAPPTLTLEEAAPAVVTGVREAIRKNIARARDVTTVDKAQETAIHVALVRVIVDVETGCTLGYEFVVPSVGDSPEAEALLQKNLQDLFERERTRRPSSLARPLPRNALDPTPRFESSAYLLAVEVISEARGIVPGATPAILGKSLTLEEFQTAPLRFAGGQRNA